MIFKRNRERTLPVRIHIEVLRREDARSQPYLQTFEYELRKGSETVATALSALNARAELKDAEGRPARPVRWSAGCLQKKCGACAMVINGRPRLACGAKLTELGTRVRLEPLSKFPVIGDLLTDRSALFEIREEMKLWRHTDALPDDAAERARYDASRCIGCGLCLEVCPNYRAGGRFAGAAGAVPAARLMAASPAEEAEVRASYRRGVFDGCGKSLACRDICPAGIDLDRMFSRSNALAVWGRRKAFETRR